MAAELPVVGARVGGIPEMIVEGQTGLLVPSKAPTELADALETLVRDPQLARNYGVAGRQRAQTAFSLSTHADRLSGIYRRVLSEKGRH
jgi:glycosyltransferase involved in cell wall biosynthesis